jgi:hypothetical protein
MSNDGNGQQGGDRRTSIDDGTRFKGTISSQHPVVVRGTVEGEVTAPALEVTETGVVTGRLRVSELRSRGEIAGEIDADEMQLAGRIRDKTILRAKLIEVRLEPAGTPGSLAFGDCELVIGQVPDKAAVVAAMNAALAPKPRSAKDEGAPARPEEPAAAKGEPAKGEDPAAAKPADAAVADEVSAEKSDAVKPPRKSGKDRTAQVS